MASADARLPTGKSRCERLATVHAAREQRRRRFAIVGVGARSQLYSHALLSRFSATATLVALCDLNPVRLAHHRGLLKQAFGVSEMPCYAPGAFEKMIQEQHVEIVIVCTVDNTHHEYIVRALNAGCDAITEKPLTTSAAACDQILEAVQATGRSVRVGFNYRYSPRNSKVKHLLSSGAVGRVLSVHFEWLLDVTHGADYFRRWHRDKGCSGGMLVHKASHHFDLVNWWIGSLPVTVCGMGRLCFYGQAAAEARNENRKERFRLTLDAALSALYGPEAVAVDGYQRDQDVFGAGVTIEDDAAVLVQYESGATLSYHLTCYSPWEGLRCSFNGTHGRLEYEVVEATCIAGAANDPNLPHRPQEPCPHGDGEGDSAQPTKESVRIVVHRHWEAPVEHVVPCYEAGHGGGDARMLEDLFAAGRSETRGCDEGEETPLGRAADHMAGVAACSVGIAANKSFEDGGGVPVRVKTLLGAARRRRRGQQQLMAAALLVGVACAARWRWRCG